MLNHARTLLLNTTIATLPDADPTFQALTLTGDLASAHRTVFGNSPSMEHKNAVSRAAISLIEAAGYGNYLSLLDPRRVSSPAGSASMDLTDMLTRILAASDTFSRLGGSDDPFPRFRSIWASHPAATNRGAAMLLALIYALNQRWEAETGYRSFYMQQLDAGVNLLSGGRTRPVQKKAQSAPRIVALEILSPTGTIYTGQTVDIRVRATWSNGSVVIYDSADGTVWTAYGITISSSHPDKLEVGAGGALTALGEQASVTITASVGTIAATRLVDVGPVTLLGLTIVQPAAGEQIPQGATRDIILSAVWSDGIEQYSSASQNLISSLGFSIGSQNTGVVSVGGTTGRLTAVSASGTSIITVSKDGISKTVSVSTKAAIPATISDVLVYRDGNPVVGNLTGGLNYDLRVEGTLTSGSEYEIGSDLSAGSRLSDFDAEFESTDPDFLPNSNGVFLAPAGGGSATITVRLPVYPTGTISDTVAVVADEAP